MNERTKIGQEIEAALGEVLAHVRGEAALACRIVDDPSAARIVALRKRLNLSLGQGKRKKEEGRNAR